MISTKYQRETTGKLEGMGLGVSFYCETCGTVTGAFAPTVRLKALDYNEYRLCVECDTKNSIAKVVVQPAYV